MQGASRAAMGAAREALAAAVDDPSVAGTVAGDLFGVVALLDREPGLRRALADATSPAKARAGLVRGLFRRQVDRATLKLLAGMVTERWSRVRDLTDAIEQLAVLATAAAAENARQLDELEDELFRFGRIVAAEPGLYAALASPVLPPERKEQLLDALLEGKAGDSTRRLITQAAVHPRGRNLETSLAEYARLAAQWRRRLIALVRVATELTGSERERLTAALAAVYDRNVQLNVVLDPEVVGGMSIQVGDEFIDGSVASRLAALRRHLAA